jgi:hypothetical protein
LNAYFDGRKKRWDAISIQKNWPQFVWDDEVVITGLMDGFEGKMTSSKWAKIGKCSADTALRDIQGLIEKGILTKAEGGGRCAGYLLVVVE